MFGKLVDRSSLAEPVYLGPVPRVAFAAATVWVVIVTLYGRSDAIWWRWPVRIGLAVPVIVLCLIATRRPKLGQALWAVALFVGWATVQAIRIQWGAYDWRSLLLNTSAYVMVVILGLVFGVHVVMMSGLACAGRRIAGDRDAR